MKQAAFVSPGFRDDILQLSPGEVGKGAGNAHWLVGVGESRMFPTEVQKLGDKLIAGWARHSGRPHWGRWVFLRIISLLDFA